MSYGRAVGISEGSASVALISRYLFPPPPAHDLLEIRIMDSVPQLHAWSDPIDCVSEHAQPGVRFAAPTPRP